MGSRAIAVCPQQDRLDCYYSQWGGSVLLTLVSTPAATAQFELLEQVEWAWHRLCSIEQFLDTLDYLSIEAVYWLSITGVQAYLPLWFGRNRVETATESTRGALVRVESPAAVRRLRECFRCLKRVLHRGEQKSIISTSAADKLLLLSICSREHHLGTQLRSVAENL